MRSLLLLAVALVVVGCGEDEKEPLLLDGAWHYVAAITMDTCEPADVGTSSDSTFRMARDGESYTITLSDGTSSTAAESGGSLQFAWTTTLPGDASTCGAVFDDTMTIRRDGGPSAFAGQYRRNVTNDAPCVPAVCQIYFNVSGTRTGD